MRNRFLVSVVAGAAFAVAAGLTPKPEGGSGRSAARAPLPFDFPAPAYASGTCSLAAIVCGNDSAPGCEIICGGEQQATCVEGTCSPAGNILTVNRCSCK